MYIYIYVYLWLSFGRFGLKVRSLQLVAGGLGHGLSVVVLRSGISAGIWDLESRSCGVGFRAWVWDLEFGEWQGLGLGSVASA